MKDLVWILGETASVVRHRKQKHWSVIQNEDLPDRDPTSIDERVTPRKLNVGVLFLLQHPKLALREDPSMYFQNRLLSKKSYSPNFLIFFILIVCISLTTLWSKFLVEDFQKLDAIRFNWPSLVVFIGGFLIAQSLMSWIEARLLLDKLSGDRRILHWTPFGVQCNPVVWSLGNFYKEAVTMIGLGVGLILCAWIVINFHLYLGVGMLLGVAFWMAMALLPLKPGAMDSFIKYFLKTEDSPYQLLKWSLEGKLLPAGQKIEAQVSWSMRFLYVILLLWIFGLLNSLKYLRSQLPQSYYTDAIFLELFVSSLGALICIYFLVQISVFYKNAWKMGRKGGVHPFEPTQDEQHSWESNSSLLFHIPILRQCKWNWEQVESGTWLIQKGTTTRRFYWIQAGEVKVYGRNEKNDLKLLAKLHSGSGFGEIALLNELPRTADVFATKDTVLASLDVDEFDAIANDFYREHFNRIVLASQLFDRLEMFQNIPSRNREEWLARALIMDMEPGEVVIQEGDSDQWMGLLIEGKMDVHRGGNLVAELSSGQLFGEMSYITDSLRAATLTCTEKSFILRWEAGWWAEQSEELGLRPFFEELVRNRKM